MINFAIRFHLLHVISIFTVTAKEIIRQCTPNRPKQRQGFHGTWKIVDILAQIFAFCVAYFPNISPYKCMMSVFCCWVMLSGEQDGSNVLLGQTHSSGGGGGGAWKDSSSKTHLYAFKMINFAMRFHLLHVISIFTVTAKEIIRIFLAMYS